MDEWANTTIGSVLTFQRGFDITRAVQRPGNVPVVSSGGIGSFHDTAAAKGPGVVIGRKGTLGQVFYLIGDYWPHDTTLWVKDFKGNLPKFVYYFMKQFSTSWLDVGSANPTLNRNHLHPLRVQWPPARAQRAIAEVLGALDDQIAANTRLATTAGALARMDFARALGLPGIGDIPVGQCATTVLGGTPSRDELSYWTDGTVGWLNSGKANEARILQPSEWITEEALSKSAAKVMPQRATVVAITGATLGQVARLEITASGNQSLIGIWSDDPAMNDWIYFAIQHEIPQLLRAATGAAQQHVNKRDLDALVLPILGGVDLATWGERVRPLLDLAAARERENLTLTATRDALLPALMSGALRVRDAERAVEQAV